MTPLILTKELRRLSERLVWYKTPEQALAKPYHFIAHVLTYGTDRDVCALLECVKSEDLKEALINAPSGIFDARSWTYWNLMIGREPVPPLPKRKF